MWWNKILSLLIALTLTELIEYLVIALWTDDKKAIPVVLIGNLITNPAVNIIMMTVRHFSSNLVIIAVSMVLLEVATILIEYLFISARLKYPSKRSMKYSRAINLCSFAFGIAMTFLV